MKFFFYWFFFQFCQLCEKDCPCETSPTKPNCKMCKVGSSTKMWNCLDGIKLPKALPWFCTLSLKQCSMNHWWLISCLSSNNKILRIKLSKIFGIMFTCMSIYFFSIVNFVTCVPGCVIQSASQVIDVFCFC